VLFTLFIVVSDGLTQLLHNLAESETVMRLNVAYMYSPFHSISFHVNYGGCRLLSALVIGNVSRDLLSFAAFLINGPHTLRI